MGYLIPLLVTLCALTAFGQEHDYDYSYSNDSSAAVNETFSDWLFELLDLTDHCVTRPCANGGRCENADEGFTCHCQEPFTGKNCQQVKAHCKDFVTCGHGSCLFKSSYPFYECKCNHPYQLPSCQERVDVCTPNPCQNGGSCSKGLILRRSTFICSCPTGYTGKFCEVEPNDCYEDNGESYRGMVSVTAGGHECLNWNSYFVLQNGDPFTKYAGFDGLGPHNFCRNPDRDTQPWCYYKKLRRLEWEHCNIRRCPKSTDPVTHPTSDPSAETVQPTQSPVKPALFSECGKPQVGGNTRIFGGKGTPPGALPWQVSLQIRPTRFSPNNFTHICGGTLISSCWVLTAAHCIKSDVEMQVVLGGVNLNKDEDYDQTIPVEKAIVHEDYRRTLFAPHNDIALLKLNVTDRSFCAKETPFVKTACLPDQEFQRGESCVVSGWGATETQIYGTNYLLDARVLLISQRKCKSPLVYGSELDDSMLCAGYLLTGGVDSCQGDSGGPLVCERNGTDYVVGVVSWGRGCGKRFKPGVYTNVAKFFSWITNHLNS